MSLLELKSRLGKFKLFLIIIVVFLSIWKSNHERDKLKNTSSPICNTSSIISQSHGSNSNSFSVESEKVSSDYHVYKGPSITKVYSMYYTSDPESKRKTLKNVCEVKAPVFNILNSKQNIIESRNVENPKHLEFYLIVREHLICITSYTIVMFFWFYLLSKSQNDSRSDFIQEVPCTEVQSSPEVPSVQIPEKKILPIKRPSLMDLNKNIHTFNKKDPKPVFQRPIPPEILVFPKETISSIYKSPQLENENKMTDSTDLNTNYTKNLNINKEIDPKLIPLLPFKDLGGDSNLKEGEPGKFLIGKTSVPKFILNKKSSKLKLKDKRSGDVIVSPSFSSDANSFTSHPEYLNSPGSPSNRNSIQNDIGRTHNHIDDSPTLDIDLNQLYNRIRNSISYKRIHPNPFWYRVSPSFVSSLGMTFTSMQFILLVSTTAIANVFEQSRIPSLFSLLSSLVKFDFLSILTGHIENSNYNSISKFPKKLSIKDFFLPTSLIKSRNELYSPENADFWKNLSNNISNTNYQPYSAPLSEYPDILKRFWQYQVVLTYISLFVIYPLTYLIFRYTKTKVDDSNDIANKKSDNSNFSISKDIGLIIENSLATGKRQRESSTTNPTPSPPPKFNLKYDNQYSSRIPISKLTSVYGAKHVDWRFVFIGMFFFTLFTTSFHKFIVGGAKLTAKMINYTLSTDIFSNFKYLKNSFINIYPLQFQIVLEIFKSFPKIFKILISFVYSLIWPDHLLYNLHVFVAFFTLLMVLISGPSGIVNQFRYISAVFPITKSQITQIISIHTKIMENLKKINGDGSPKKRNSDWETFKEKGLSKYFNWASHPNLSKLISKTSPDCFTGKKSTPDLSLKKLDLPPFRDTQIDGPEKTIGNNPSLEFDFKPIDSLYERQNANNDILAIKNLLVEKQLEVLNTKVFDRVRNRKQFFWASPTLRNLIFLFFFGIWGFFWLLLVLQSISGMLNAFFFGPNDINLILASAKDDMRSGSSESNFGKILVYLHLIASQMDPYPQTQAPLQNLNTKLNWNKYP
ncbi:hypothetical protein AYI68_g8324 [Smittium mucronatum]|uniref:Uncharacterized protein n=1 Tax=Smittium mucronatum TaxID=133383 RepID=A0A1R0GL76_9FUNG|nr:hypothetical protein AYI68_g8324 [Smittium mucronatum]